MTAWSDLLLDSFFELGGGSSEFFFLGGGPEDDSPLSFLRFFPSLFCL